MRIVVNKKIKLIQVMGNHLLLYNIHHNLPLSMKNSILLLSCIIESTVSISIFDFKRLWNASHIYRCTHPKPKIYGYGRNVHLRHFPWPKRPWPKCPGRNVLGRNVRAPLNQYACFLSIRPFRSVRAPWWIGILARYSENQTSIFSLNKTI